MLRFKMGCDRQDIMWSEILFISWAPKPEIITKTVLITIPLGLLAYPYF